MVTLINNLRSIIFSSQLSMTIVVSISTQLNSTRIDPSLIQSMGDRSVTSRLEGKALELRISFSMHKYYCFKRFNRLKVSAHMRSSWFLLRCLSAWRPIILVVFHFARAHHLFHCPDDNNHRRPYRSSLLHRFPICKVASLDLHPRRNLPPRRRHWSPSMSHQNRSVAHPFHDKISRFLLNRCRRNEISPLDEHNCNWDDSSPIFVCRV